MILKTVVVKKNNAQETKNDGAAEAQITIIDRSLLDK